MNGKPKVVSQVYLGSIDTMLKRLQCVESSCKPLKVAFRQFGALFVLNELKKDLDTIGIVDGIIKRGSRETGPTLGEYFFYAWANRLTRLPGASERLPTGTGILPLGRSGRWLCPNSHPSGTGTNGSGQVRMM